MKISVSLNRIIIKDAEGGEKHEVLTLRTAKNIAEIAEETEREEAIQHLSEAVSEAYHKHNSKTVGRD